MDPPAGQVTNRAMSRAECRAFDERARAAARVPGELLMENAGAAVARAALALASERRAEKVIFVCGAGNNGGDGFVAARHLIHTIPLEVWLTGGRARAAREAAANLSRLEALGIVVFDARGETLRAALSQKNIVIVDAIFGTGLGRPVSGEILELIAAINESGAAILAVDVPSGLDADTGEMLGAAVRADITITFVAKKIGFARGRGPELCGRVEVAGIGVPVI